MGGVMRLLELIEGETPDPKAKRFNRRAVERAMERSEAPMRRERPETRIHRGNPVAARPAMEEFIDASLGDLRMLLGHPRPTGWHCLLTSVRGVADAMKQPRGAARATRGALLQVAAAAIEWSARLERDERAISRG